LTFFSTGIIVSFWAFTNWVVDSDVRTRGTVFSGSTGGTLVGTTDTGVTVIEETIWAATGWSVDSWWDTFSTVRWGIDTSETLRRTWGTFVQVVITVVSSMLSTFWAGQTRVIEEDPWVIT